MSTGPKPGAKSGLKANWTWLIHRYVDNAAMLIETIQQSGSRFALGEFGSGFSPFVCLKLLPVDYLKSDGMFIREIEANKVNHALVSAI